MQEIVTEEEEQHFLHLSGLRRDSGGIDGRDVAVGRLLWYM